METYWDRAVWERGRGQSATPARVLILADFVMSVGGRV